MPFDWRTLLGYPFAWMIEYAAVFTTFFVVSPNICLTGGMCWLVISITKDVTNDLHLLNIAGRSTRSQTKAKKNFLIILKFYLELKELSEQKNDLNSEILDFYNFLAWFFFDLD